MADILSQEEIDRLLTATGAEPTPTEAELTPTQVEVVEKQMRGFFASANSTLAALLAAPATVSEGLGQAVDVADLDTARHLLVRFSFRSGLAGEMALLLRHRDASILADLILGGEGAPKQTLEATDLDALAEAATQIAGSGAPTLSAALGRDVGFSPPTVLEVDEGGLAEALPWGRAFLSVGNIAVESMLETPLRFLLTVELAREMAHLARSEKETAPEVLVATPPHIRPARVQTTPTVGERANIRNIDLIMDIEIEAMVRLGESVMPLKDIQRLRPGSIINLDKDTDAPVELLVNDRVIAKGELVVVGSDHFALRITEVETPVERIRTLGP